MQKYCKILLIILVPIIAYLMSFGVLIYDSDYYTKLTEEYSSIDAAGMNKDMVNYFQTGTMPASFDAFNEKEKVHLEEVRIVINRLIILLLVLILLFILLLNYAENKREVFFYSGITTILLPLLFFLPFDTLFTQMHNIFFAKGSWVFDADALLVNLYPVQFFYAFAKGIFLRSFCLGLVITLLSKR